MAKRPSWVCTLITQLSLCLALYVALNLGQPQKSIYQRTNGISSNRKGLDFYFISVTGGFRPLEQQTLLLKQMEDVAKAYDARFVINSSELGEDDPLKQNLATNLHVSFAGYLVVPVSKSSMVYYMLFVISSLTGAHLYTTKASKEKEVGCFQEQIRLPHGEALDIIGVNTGSLQGKIPTALPSASGDLLLNWLKSALEATNGHWCIVVGFHPLVICEEHEEQLEAKKIYEPLHHIFMKFGVNTYLSKHGCIKYSRQDSITYMENPGLIESGNGREMVDGFLLHKVSSLEIVGTQIFSAFNIAFQDSRDAN
ncbi:calcineurin-like metallo-phosphoesterase superfamily protein [Citrus sinensis]|nr:calcineurin-like metallo-phosphoesterase superfamily protein [Citrus sinensis]